MLITVQVAPDLASALRRGEPETEDARELKRMADDLGISFRSLHPDSANPSLRSYFTVDVPDAAEAERVLTRLRRSPAVRAAYVKPPDAPA